jgi:hypothetical protein
MVGIRMRTWSALGVVLLATLLAVVLVPAPAASGQPGEPTAVITQSGLALRATIFPTTSITLRPGMSGPAVRALQERLVELKYWLGSVDGIYGYLTTQAVMASRKSMASHAMASWVRRQWLRWSTPRGQGRGARAIGLLRSRKASRSCCWSGSGR